MKNLVSVVKKDPFFVFTIFYLIITSIFILNSISASIFPLYYVFILLALLSFILFVQIDFEVLTLFSPHLYIFSLILLLLPLIIGQVTRGAIRWIPLGPLTLQPSEIVRPFLLIFFAMYLDSIKKITVPTIAKTLILFGLPVFMILIQPSLGVAILTVVGYIGVLFASKINKKYIWLGFISVLFLIPLSWLFLAPYQKQRVISFINPALDPYGGGYNSIQAMISVGSGRLFGRGLGKGIQTQLAFLPEKHTDFIFAATAEELGMVGSMILLIGLFLLLFQIIKFIDRARGPVARAYITGVFLVLFTETMIHIGMNIGIVPITGVPLPLVSAGGSSLLATMISLAICISSQPKV